MNYADWRPFLTSLAMKAGEVMIGNFSLGMNREIKSDRTPVTESDLAINRMVIEKVSEFSPDTRVLGEEESNSVEAAEFTLLCDPVDGTIPFCRGIPIASVVLALLHHDTPVASVIYDPFMRRMWSAVKGEGSELFTWRDDGYHRITSRHDLEVSRHSKIEDAHVGMIWWRGSPYNLHAACNELMNRNGEWSNPVSIAYLGGLVASGEIDATVFPGRKGWETAAMQVLVEEAGGMVTDINGNPMRYGPNGEIEGHIVSNGLIHDELVEIIACVQ